MIPYKVISENRLTHSSGAWKKHKYKSRTGTPGNYVYDYGEDGSDDLRTQLEEAQKEVDEANAQINDALDEYEGEVNGLKMDGQAHLGSKGTGAKINYKYDPFEQKNKNSMFNISGDGVFLLDSSLSDLNSIDASPAINFLNNAFSVQADVSYEKGTKPSIGNVKVNFSGGNLLDALNDSKAGQAVNRGKDYLGLEDDHRAGPGASGHTKTRGTHSKRYSNLVNK